MQEQRQNITSVSIRSTVFYLSSACLDNSNSSAASGFSSPAFPLPQALGGIMLVKDTSIPYTLGGSAGSLLSRDPPCFVGRNWPEHWPLTMTRVRPFPAVAIAMGSFRLFPYRAAVSEFE